MELNNDGFLLKSYSNNLHKINEPSKSNDTKIKYDPDDNDEDEDDGNDDDDDDDSDDDNEDTEKNNESKCKCKVKTESSKKVNEFILKLPLSDQKFRKKSDFSFSSKTGTNKCNDGSEIAVKNYENELSSGKSSQIFQAASSNQCSSRNLPLNEFSSSTSAAPYDPIHKKIQKFEQQDKLKNKNKIKSMSLDSPSITLIDCEQSNESLIDTYEYDLNEQNQSNTFNASKSCDLGQEQIFEENFNKNKNNIKSISLDSSRSLLTDADENQQINQNKSELHPNYSVIIIDDNIDTYKNSRSKSRIDSEMFNHKISSISMPATPLKNFLLLEQQQKHQQSSKNLQLLKLNKSSSLSNNNLKTLPEILNDFYIQDLDESLANDAIEQNSKSYQEPSTSGHYINTKNQNTNSKSDLDFENQYNFNLNLNDMKNTKLDNEINDIDTNLKTKLISKSNYNLNNTLNINRTDDFNCKTNLSKSSLNLNLNNIQKQNSQINLLNSKTNSNNTFTLSSAILMPTQIAIQSNQINNGKKNLLQRRGSNTSLTLNLNKNKTNSGSCCYLNNRFSNSYNSLNLSATHFQQQQQQQQHQPLNHQHQQHKFGGFQPNSQKLIKPLSSLSLYQKQGSMITPTSTATTMNMSKKKGLLERRNSNTSLTLNLQQQQSYQNYKQQIGSSISNYNLNSSSSSLNSINSNDFQQQQQSQQDTQKLQGEHDILSDFHQNPEFSDEIKNKRKFSIRKDSFQSKAMDDNDDNNENNQFFETSGTESNHSHYQQRRKFLSSDGLNKIPQYSRLNQAHIRNLSKTCFGSVSDLKPTMIKSRNSDLNINQFENSLNYTKPLQEDSQFRKSEINLNEINNFVMDTNASNYGFFDSSSDPNSKFKFHTNLCSCTGMRNITTRPLSPQSTSEDFKIYLANIQLLQNATNQLNYEKLKKFTSIFDNLFNAEESCDVEDNLKAKNQGAGHGNGNRSREKTDTDENAIDAEFKNENKSNGKQFKFSKEELKDLNSQSNALENPTSKNSHFESEAINPEETLKPTDSLYFVNERSNQHKTSNPKQIDYEKQKAEQKLLICQLHQEFWDLPTNYQEKPFVFNSQSKNRYRTILPNEHSRFQFKVNEFIVTNNKFHLNQEQQHHQEPYINANYIKGPDNTTNCYVAAQGPMSNTLYEHWLMILQNLINFNQKLIKNNKNANESTKNSNKLFNFNLNQKIIMLTNFYESNRQKCSIYFPINLNQMILINNSNDLIDIIDNDLYKFYENHLNYNLDSEHLLDNSQDTDDNDDTDGIFSLNKISFSKCIIQQNHLLYNKLIKYNNYFLIKNVHINDLNDFSVRKFQCLFIQTIQINGKKSIKSNYHQNVETKENYVKKSLDLVFSKNLELKFKNNNKLKNSNTDSANTNSAIKLIIKKFHCKHYWYPNWPDHCSPNNIKSLLEMCTKILNNNELETKSKPELNRGPCTSKNIEAFSSQYDFNNSLASNSMKLCSNLNNLFQFNFHDQTEQPLPIIHCSAGIGRTGCLAAILNCIKQIHLTIDYDYFNKNKRNLNSIEFIFDKFKINDKNNIENNLSDFKTRINHNSINKNLNQNLIEFKNFILKNLCVDILAVVCNLRLQRGGMVQNSEQYELIHRAICLYVKCLEENLEKSF